MDAAYRSNKDIIDCLALRGYFSGGCQSTQSCLLPRWSLLCAGFCVEEVQYGRAVFICRRT
eukprot:2625501-Prorocentrum_lima.AAC.1